MDSARLARLAEGQGGVFARRQVRQCGYTPYQIRRRIAAGEWLVVVGSILAGPSAARRWRMPVGDHGPCLYVGRHARPSLPGLRLLYLMPGERDIGRHGVDRFTWRERTVVDCVRLLPRPEAAGLLDTALLRRWITPDDLIGRLVESVGHARVHQLRDLVGDVVNGTRSAAERVAADLLTRAGLAGWEANGPVSDEDGLIGLVDLLFRKARLAIEIDGMAFHVTPAQFQRDRERQNRLLAAGWMVLRFTWRDLTERPAEVIAQIRRALAR